MITHEKYLEDCKRLRIVPTMTQKQIEEMNSQEKVDLIRPKSSRKSYEPTLEIYERFEEDDDKE